MRFYLTSSRFSHGVTCVCMKLKVLSSCLSNIHTKVYKDLPNDMLKWKGGGGPHTHTHTHTHTQQSDFVTLAFFFN